MYNFTKIKIPIYFIGEMFVQITTKKPKVLQ